MNCLSQLFSSLTHSLTDSFPHSLTDSLTHSLTLSINHSITLTHIHTLSPHYCAFFRGNLFASIRNTAGSETQMISSVLFLRAYFRKTEWYSCFCWLKETSFIPTHYTYLYCIKYWYNKIYSFRFLEFWAKYQEKNHKNSY